MKLSTTGTIESSERFGVALMLNELSIIIPAAGYGTRMGMLSMEAKELLPHPVTQSPLIEECLNKVQDLNAKVSVIVRKNKTPLIQFLEVYRTRHPMDLNITELASTKEWPDTLLQRQSCWSELNFLILPDTEFQPQSILQRMLLMMSDSVDVVFATWNVDDYQNWGMVKVYDGKVEIADKPRLEKQGSQAWGIILFRKKIGEIVFQNILESLLSAGAWKSLNVSAATIKLDYFFDLTRGSR